MKPKIAFVLVLCLLAFAACKKGLAPFNGVKINTVTDFKSGSVSTYSYNADGSVALITQRGIGNTTFGYIGDTVIMTNLNTLGASSDGYIYVRNSSGYAVSANGIIQSINKSSTYSYDANGVLDQQKDYRNGTAITQVDYTKGNNDIATMKRTDLTNNTYVNHYYTYLTSNTNSIGVQNKGQFYLGVSSANLVLSDIQINANGDTTNVITYQYKYDGNSNVDTLVSHDRSGNRIDSIGYTYY